jgi:hypothetical protein
MGIALGALQFLLQEGSIRPWQGSALTLGRQDTSFGAAEFNEMAKRFTTPAYRPSVSGQDAIIDDRRLFEGLGFSELRALDLDSYEGADIIHDLNDAGPPEDCRRRFDLVLDGGTLEHVFDIFSGLRATCEMVRFGGRVVHISPLSNCVDHGFYSFSPTLFADFYSANGWAVRRIAIARFFKDPSKDPWTLVDYESRKWGEIGALEPGSYFTLACAQRLTEAPCDVRPQQSYYREVWSVGRTPASG